MAFNKIFTGMAFSLILFLISCDNNPIETIEQRDGQGRLERFERRKKDFAKHGLYQRFYENGALALASNYQNDSLHGLQKFYYRNGKLESVESFTNGVNNGKFLKYYEDGVLQVEQEFIEGAMQGLSVAYYPSGKIREKVTIKDNLENGPFTEYYENGKLMVEGTYAPDAEDEIAEQGELKEYDSTGVLIRIANCVNGVCITKWKK